LPRLRLKRFEKRGRARTKPFLKREVAGGTAGSRKIDFFARLDPVFAIEAKVCGGRKKPTKSRIL